MADAPLPSLEINHIFDDIGSFGWYQKRLILMMAYIAMIVGSIMSSLPTFTAGEPRWQCSEDSTVCNITGFMKPTDPNYEDRCSMDKKDWMFERGYTSIITEWNLVCDQSILQSVAQSMVFVGWFLGLIIFGFIADKRGRKPALIFSSVLAVCSSFVTAFSGSIAVYIVGRFVTGVGLGGAVMLLISLPSEFCSKGKQRGIAATAPWIGWAIGNLLLPLCAYYIRNWRHLIVAVSSPGFLVIAFWWMVDESPRWLMVSGKDEKAMVVLNKIARVNNKIMPVGKLSAPTTSGNEKTGNVLYLFKSRSVVKITLVMWFSWFAVSLLAYGTIFASVAMTSDPYLNYGIVGSAGFPCILLSIILQEKCGRRVAIMICYSFAMIFSLTALLLPDKLQTTASKVGQTTCFFMINLSVGGAFNVIYVYTSELYPTSVRNVGMSWCSAMARIGSFASPYIIWMQRIHAAIPLSIMVACSIASGILVLLLRETKTIVTMETISDMEMDDTGRSRGA